MAPSSQLSSEEISIPSDTHKIIAGNASIINGISHINAPHNMEEDELLCVNGILLPAWLPLKDVGKGMVAFRGIVYIIALAYLFAGVAILADRFMASIEMITSKKKEVKLREENGQTKTVVVRVWNETVANLTLMALGSSAPEILLSSIEIIGKNFEAGELGPGSTVGSAAFNLFVIIGVCNLAIPDGETRRIKRVSVFLVTTVWSIFAYLWLYLITSQISPGVIELWEALLTFAFFPLTVCSAYIADRRVHIYDYISKTYRMGRNGVIVEMTTDESNQIVADRDLQQQRSASHFKKFAEENEDEEVREFEDHRRNFIILLKNLRRKYPTLTSNQLELMATKELLGRGTRSKAFYRTLASRLLAGQSNNYFDRTQQDVHNLNLTELFKEFHPPALSSPTCSPMRNIDCQITKVSFSPGHYTVMENVGEFNVTVIRQDGDLNQQLLVDYATEDGEAQSGKDFEESHGTITFEPGVASKDISIRIIDDQLYEEDQHFYIRLFNLRSGNREEYLSGKGDISDDAYVITADIHNEPAPLYSTTIEIEDEIAPPRYSVTAREVLSALKANKNMRRPSWFHYGESESSSSSDDDSDDIFVDAVSQIDNEEVLVDEVFQELDHINVNSHQIQPNNIPVQESNKVETPMTQSPLSRSTSKTSIRKPTRHSVEFSSDGPSCKYHRRSAFFTENSSDSDTDEQPNHTIPRISEHSSLRLVCPSLATVMILDDDHHGIFSLTERSVCLTETVGTYNIKVIRCGGSRGRVALSYKTEEGTAKVGRDYQHTEGELVFDDGETEKSVGIPIMIETAYEKNVVFYFSIAEPKVLKGDSEDDSAIDLEELSMRAYSQLTEQQRTALKGRAQLGEVTTINIRLKENKQFKSTVDKLLDRANTTFRRGTSSWKQQIIDAIHLEKEEEIQQDDQSESLRTRHQPTWKDYVLHGLLVFWRLIFALIPPEGLGGGYPCFASCVVGIGVMTSLIGDVASHLGCTVGLKDTVTALAFVSLGTSLPDLFASKIAAVQDEHADASISNVIGSNTVNVFLGIGVAWMLATFHHSYHGTIFYVDSGTLAFSVTLYCGMAVIAIIILLIRRREFIGGELGGPVKWKVATSSLFVGFFGLYILLSSLEAYEYISGF